jgi:hypothetical protein
MNNRKTQRSAILKLLIAAHGQEVPLPRIADLAAQYNARLFELRRQGFRIINRTRTIDGVKHSWFRLEIGLAEDTPCTSESLATTTPPETFPQFGSLSPERYPD